MNEDIQRLVDHPVSWVRGRIAGWEETSEDALIQLTRDNEDYVRTTAASNPNTPSAALIRLSKSLQPSLREAVASNPSTPLIALQCLAYDLDVNVRIAIGSNGSTPIGALEEIIATHEDASAHWAKRGLVYRQLQGGDMSDAELASQLDDGDWATRIELSTNTKTPADILDRLSKDRDPRIRYGVAQNGNTAI